jgi:hypothetical protein
MSFFETNMQVLQQKNSFLWQKLSSIQDVENFEIFMDEDDITSLNFVHTKHFTPLYEGSPVSVIQTQLQEYEMFVKHPYLYIYGIANGTLLKHLLSNTIHQRILVIEPEVELLYVVLHMIDFSQELENGRLVILGYEDVDFPTLIGYFLKYQEHKYAKTYNLHVNTFYYDKYFSEHMQQTNRVITEAIYHAINIAGNDTVDSLIGLKHHIANLARVLETPPLFELLKKLHTCDTAVLVSTGPSLTKQLPLLKKIAPYVRIIAVDASFPVLYKAGIKPDVVVSIERVKESARFFTEMPKEAFKDVVFALSSVQHRDVVQSIKGGTMQMSLRPLDLMMYTGPEHWGYIGLGQSAANMAYELIYHSEFKNCILIGQDLAYGADGKSHARGHVFGQENVKTKESDVWVKGWQGKEQVRTNHTWDMFRRSFEKDIGDTKVRMLTINATEGGASIYGTLEIPFSQAVESCVDLKHKQTNLKLSCAAAHEKERIAKETWSKVNAMTEYVAKLLDESKAIFLEVALACEQESSTLDDFFLISLTERIEGIKKRYNEEIYEKVVWHIAQTTMLSKEVELAPVEVFITKDAQQERERLLHLVQAYKPWLFLFAGILDSILQTVEYAKVRRLIDEVETIDIYVENEKIDSFTSHNLVPKIGRVFDVDMRGILYDVPDAYQEQIDDVVFKDAKTSQVLPKAFVDVIKRDDAKYNELSFMRSLEEPIDEEKIKDLCCPNVIGFLATKENLEDEEFIKYIKELIEKFPNVKFKGLSFDQATQEKNRKVFENMVSAIIPKDIYDIASQIEIYIFNNAYPAMYRNVFYKLRYYASKLGSLQFIRTDINLTLGSPTSTHPCLLYPEVYEFTQEEVRKAQGSGNRLVYTRINSALLSDANLFEYKYYDIVLALLQNTKTKDYLYRIQKTHFETLKIQI